MKKPLRIALWIAGVVVLGFAGVVGLVFSSLSNAGYVFDNGKSLQENLSGRWDWEINGPACADSTHVIAFSSDGKTMTLTQQYPMIDSAGKDWTVATYDIISMTPSRVRGAIRGETRLTDEGKPVVWDLVVFDANRYRWHQADWPSWAYTTNIVRCPGEATHH